jgi:cytochrome b subunit of formate dehydrogenase
MFNFIEKYPIFALLTGFAFVAPKFTFYVVSTIFCLYFLKIVIGFLSDFIKGK